MSDSAWKRGFLLAALIVLGCGEIMASVVFATSSVDFIAKNHNARAAAYSENHLLAAPATLRFAFRQADTQRLGDGWNFAEQQEDGIWSSRNDAFIAIAARDKGSDLVLHLDVALYTSSKTPRNRIEVSVDGTVLAAFERTVANSDEPIEVRVPAALTQSGTLRIKLHVDRCGSPQREGSGTDPRTLGVLLKMIEILRG